MDVLLLKLFLAPLLVVASTLAGRRWGPAVTGILVALPVVAGPILFIIYRQHGAGFAGDAATASLLGLVSLAVFSVVFARVSARFGWLVTLVLSWTVVLVVDVLLVRVGDLPAPAAFASTLAALTLGLLLMPRTGPPDPAAAAPPVPAPRWDLPGRAVATGVLVFAVTSASGALGPLWTGILAPFPIATSVVASFVHAQQGHAVTARTLAGALIGLFGFALFCLVVAVLVRPLGGIAFVVATVVSVAVQLLVVRARAGGGPRETPDFR